MSIVSDQPSAHRVILHGVSWETYERLLHDFEGGGSPRIAFDHGAMEIVTLREGRYSKQSASSALPMLTTEIVMERMAAGRTTKRPAWLRQTREQIRKLIGLP